MCHGVRDTWAVGEQRHEALGWAEPPDHRTRSAGLEPSFPLHFCYTSVTFLRVHLVAVELQFPYVLCKTLVALPLHCLSYFPFSLPPPHHLQNLMPPDETRRALGPHTQSRERITTFQQRLPF